MSTKPFRVSLCPAGGLVAVRRAGGFVCVGLVRVMGVGVRVCGEEARPGVGLIVWVSCGIEICPESAERKVVAGDLRQSGRSKAKSRGCCGFTRAMLLALSVPMVYKGVCVVSSLDS